MPKIPYDYQEDAIASLIEYWGNGGGSALIEIPTGGGKSLVMAELMHRLHTQFDGTRILLLTHVQELVEQDADELTEQWPDAPLGIYSAGLGRRDGQAPLCFASVQSVYKNPEVVGPRDVVFIDEAHLLSRKDDGQYQRVLTHLRSVNPSLRLAGFTATTYRTDSGLLTDTWRDKPALFDDLVYRIDPLKLIQRGILAPLTPYAPHTRLDVSGVRKQGGEYVAKELQAAVDKSNLNEAAIDEVFQAGESRAAWIIFAAGVEHAEHLRDIIRGRGVDAEMILGDTPKAERRDIIERYKSRQLRCIVGNNVLTTGFNARHIDLIAMLRPTDSKGLHVQMMGRGLRTAEGKSDCLVLDFAGNTVRHGCLDMIDGSKNPGAPGTPPAKECDACGHICHISAKVCPQCNAPFPIIEDPKFSSRSSGAPIFSIQAEPVWYDIEGIICRKHIKEGKAPSLRIDYACGLGTVSHWVTLEHETAGGMARRWWERNSHSGVAPQTVDEALRRIDDLRLPGRIQTIREGKYTRVTHWDYSIPPNKVIPVQRMLSPSSRPSGYAMFKRG